MRDAVSTVTRKMLTNVWADLDHLSDVWAATNGGHIILNL